MKYAICVSGNLGNVVLQNLISDNLSIAAVFTDKHSDTIIETAEQNQLKCFVGNPRGGRAIQWIDENKIRFEHLLSINYLFILEEDIINRVSGYPINFHGSLLPKYRGRTPHVWAIINGEKETGITAHIINTKCDDGDIVKQIKVAIEENDTGAEVLNKYNKLYPTLVQEIIKLIEQNQINLQPQDNTKATYYSKRTPDDGHIDWDWQKERIRNWVRAQAKPYPGAFTYLNDRKITIHEILYSDLGYIDTVKNGTVIGFEKAKPVVKTKNGAVLLNQIETDIDIQINSVLR